MRVRYKLGKQFCKKVDPRLPRVTKLESVTACTLSLTQKRSQPGSCLVWLINYSTKYLNDENTLNTCQNTKVNPSLQIPIVITGRSIKRKAKRVGEKQRRSHLVQLLGLEREERRRRNICRLSLPLLSLSSVLSAIQ